MAAFKANDVMRCVLVSFLADGAGATLTGFTCGSVHVLYMFCASINVQHVERSTCTMYMYMCAVARVAAADRGLRVYQHAATCTDKFLLVTSHNSNFL